ncbi:MAG: tetratricopeptide repeat protein [Clostridiales bacterium]
MIKTFKDRKVRFLILTILTIPLFMTGCGLWSDFTAYFNLYYNASRLFNDTEQELNTQRKNLFTLQDPKPSGSVSQNLTKVIEKLSKLLQFDSKSGYVDDALLMIGKCFYYQQDYQKALRKFTELISTLPNSDLVLEDQLWIGKTQLRLRNYTQANTILDQVRQKAKEGKNKEILIQTYVEQISYLINVEKYDDAIAAAKELIAFSDDGETNALAVYETGKLYLKIDQPENAAKAFADVRNYSPNFETEYLSRLQYGKVQRKLGKAESALNVFNDIEDEAKYNQYLDSTKLQVALTYMDLKRFDEATKEFAYIDTTFKQSPNSGTASYYLGEIMEKHLGNFDSAAYYYKKASSSTAPLEFTQRAGRKLQIFTKYSTLQANIGQYQKQLIYSEKPSEFLKDSLAYVKEVAIRDSLAKENLKQKANTNNEGNSEYQAAKSNRSERSDQSLATNGSNTFEQKKVKNLVAPLRPVITADSIKIILAKNEYELGSLFFTDLNYPDSVYYYYTHLLSYYPNNYYTPRTIYALGTYYQTLNDTVKADSLFTIVYERYPNESLVNAAADKLGKPLVNLKYDAAEELYVNAEKKMKEDNFKEAISGFEEVYHKYPKSPFAPKALYASGWVFENKLKLFDSAAVVYDSVISKYPMTQYANSVRGKVTVYKDEQRKIKAAEDSAKAKLNPPAAEKQTSDSLKTINPQINNNASSSSSQPQQQQ